MLYDPASWRRFRGLPTRSGFMWDGNRQMNTTSSGGPSGPVTSLDFVNGVYTVNNTSVVPSTFVSTPSRITPGLGFRIRATALNGGSTAPALLTGTVLAQLQGRSWTVVIFQNTTVFDGGGSRNYLLNLWKTARGDTNNLSCYTGGGGGVVFEFDGTTTRNAVSNDWVNNLGKNHVAFSRTDTHAATVNDGLTDSLGTNDGTAISQSYSVIDIADAWTALVDGYIERMDIYVPVKPDGNLRALTLPTPT